MDLADHFRVIAHNWWRILLVALLVGAGVYFVSGRKADVYQADAQLSVTAAERQGLPVSRDETTFLTDTYAQRATTRPVLERAIKDGKLQMSVFTAQDRVSATASTDVGFLHITAQGPTPSSATRLANAVSNALIADVTDQQRSATLKDIAPVQNEIAQVAAQLDALPNNAPERTALETRYTALLQAAVERETQPTNRVDLVAAASPPNGRASPSPLRDGLLGFLVALVVAAEVSVGVEALSDRLPRNADPGAIARLLGHPVLATIPRGNDDDRAVVEGFRTLRTSLAALPPDQRPRTVAVASAHAGAGKSFTAINLARSAAAPSGRVLLVDADLRRPVIHQRLDVPRQPGLTDVLAGRSPQGAVHSVGPSAAYAVGEPRRFLVLPSGPAVPDPVVALSNEAVQRVVAAMGEPPDLAIFDTPPASLFGDATTVASQCDATILILDLRKSRLRATRNMITTFSRSGASILGVVVNRTVAPRAGRYYGG